MQLGAKHVESPFIEFGQISTAIYFLYFVAIVPFITVLENSLVDLSKSLAEKKEAIVLATIKICRFLQKKLKLCLLIIYKHRKIIFIFLILLVTAYVLNYYVFMKPVDFTVEFRNSP